MLHICTTSDSNYLHKGLALYASLERTLGYKNFDLHWLCLNDECYTTLSKLVKSKAPYSTNIYLYTISEFESKDAELVKLKNCGHKSQHGTAEANYIWALTPYFINYLLHNIIPANEKLMYADADIFFYYTPQLIFDVVGTKSVGIHTHRFGGNKKTSASGWYNVGVMIFSNDAHGIKISDLWKDWVMHPNPTENKYYKEYGLCGDQKYVELFPVILGEEHVCVFDENSAISHRAPWCCDEDNRSVYFYHFSHFTFSIEKNWWRDHVNEKAEWRPSANPHIYPYYEKYYQEIRKANEVLKSIKY